MNQKFNPDEWQPLNNWLLAKIDEVEERSAGGIILTATTKEKEQFSQVYGTIVEMSADCYPSPEFSKKPVAGDRIAFDRHAGKYADNDGKYRWLSDVDVIASKKPVKSTKEK